MIENNRENKEHSIPEPSSQPAGESAGASKAGQDETSDFYIGWMPRASRLFVRPVRKYLLLLILVVVLIGAALALNQKKFSTANFEFGKLTTIKGIYGSRPVPHLLLSDHSDWVMVPLVGYGKHGAEGVMNELAKEQKSSLENKELTLKGTLLYGDGKILMQVDKNDAPLVSASGLVPAPTLQEKEEGQASLRGEIIDPKCYFGVMKPGEGKPHKDCAIRCILGGIPPVLKITNEKGEKDYVLLISSKYNINEWVKDFVATSAQVGGRLKKYNNWQVLDVSAIQELAIKNIQGQERVVIACASTGCRKM